MPHTLALVLWAAPFASALRVRRPLDNNGVMVNGGRPRGEEEGLPGLTPRHAAEHVAEAEMLPGHL